MVGMQRSALGFVLAVALAAAVWAPPRAVLAQDLPSYATPATVSTDETVHGRIRSVDGAFSITVADDRGFIDTVSLHAGTIINPTGLTLSAGMSVTILGYNAGSTFSANEIDTPYSYAGPLPVPVYYGAGYWYPGFAYGYGPSFGLAIVFGAGGFYGPWHYQHCGFYGRPWNGHAYFGAYVGHVPLGTSTARSGHVPAAFAGRSFAGENRVYTAERGTDERGTIERGEHVFSSESTSREPVRSAAASMRSTTPSMRAAAPSIRGGGGSRGGGGGRTH